MDITKWLANWYKENCDGDWEHSNKIQINTLDNPGWSFEVDLIDTHFEGVIMSVQNFTNKNDWYEVKCDGMTFHALGDATKLNELIDTFKQFVEANSN